VFEESLQRSRLLRDYSAISKACIFDDAIRCTVLRITTYSKKFSCGTATGAVIVRLAMQTLNIQETITHGMQYSSSPPRSNWRGPPTRYPLQMAQSVCSDQATGISPSFLLLHVKIQKYLNLSSRFHSQREQISGTSFPSLSFSSFLFHI
jgi:hypothetical protein